MGVSKVEFGGDTLIDLTSDTVTPETLAEGVTATDASGNKIVGRMSIDPKAIIDVVELPTENIDEDMFYRVVTGTFVFNQYVQNAYTVYCVDGLPEVGEPATNANMPAITAYYNTQNGELYGYVDAMLSQFFGVPIGWYPASMLFQAAGLNYKGIITDILDDPRDDSYRILLEYVIYSYKGGKWTSNKTIGWVGDGDGAEVFNLPWNKAYGAASHAEGRGTVAGVEGEKSYGQHAEGYITEALGEASHAEGYASHAKGDYSHVEGDHSHAEGEASHAEGFGSRAEGNYSHAEGFGSHAEGYASHAEGDGTIASGDASHAQGKYNIEDTENKYAHIVGNGTNGYARSNAHTLDWNGVAWFAGDVKVGGTGQDDPNAKTLQTKTDESLETEDKSVVGAINEVNGKTVDKVTYMETDPDRQSIGYSTLSGIYWKGERRFYDSDENELCQFAYDGTVPIVAGDNISIDLDETNKVFKINATGGGGTENAVLIFTVDTAPPTTMSAIITAIQDGGGDITEYNYVQLNGFFTGLLLMKFQYYDGNTYKATCNDIINGYKIYNATTDNVCDVTSKGIREFLEEGKHVAMPQIRFANVQDLQGNMRLYEGNPFTFTVEIVGGGELKEGDLLQICVRRKYWYKNHEIRHKWKLRKVVQREITAEDIGKRFLSINVTLADVESRGNWMFCNDRKTSNVDTHSYMYFRIKRATKWSDATGEECDAIFSNVEKVAKTYEYSINKLTIK